MKLLNTSSLILLAGAFTAIGTPGFAQYVRSGRPAPIVISPPAIPDGSNASRAPFPARRTFDDVKAPDGQAVDMDVPPNTLATEPPAPPPPRVAILQRAPSIEPGLLPTGRPSTGLAVAVSAPQFSQTLRTQTFENRDQIVADLNARLDAGDRALQAFESTEKEMSPQGRMQFRAAADAAQKREGALRRSVRAAHKADAASWDSARAELAADYDAYLAAASQVDVTVGLPPVVR